jgi:hypothetical protein
LTTFLRSAQGGSVKSFVRFCDRIEAILDRHDVTERAVTKQTKVLPNKSLFQNLRPPNNYRPQISLDGLHKAPWSGLCPDAESGRYHRAGNAFQRPRGNATRPYPKRAWPVPQRKVRGPEPELYVAVSRPGVRRCSSVFEMSSKAGMLGARQAIGVLGALNPENPSTPRGGEI